MNERTLFLKALEQPTPERRQAFLDQACGDDAPLPKCRIEWDGGVIEPTENEAARCNGGLP